MAEAEVEAPACRLALAPACLEAALVAMEAVVLPAPPWVLAAGPLSAVPQRQMLLSEAEAEAAMEGSPVCPWASAAPAWRSA